MGVIGASERTGLFVGPVQGVTGMAGLTGHGSQTASNDLGFQTPRSSVFKRQFDRDGYPVSPAITVIKPPPGPPPDSPQRVSGISRGVAEGIRPQQVDRPEEPAKYIYEIPKLPPADISTSAVACGNWVAQVRQIFAGISPSSDLWWSAVEGTAGQQHQRWLITDPVDLLLLDPATVAAMFDPHK